MINESLIISLILFYPGFLFSLSIHEAAHGWVANRLGDPTAKLQNRVTLNPIPHMDPIGTVLLPIMGFIWGGVPVFGYVVPIIGWGKPVPVNPRNLKNWKKDGLWIAAAGPASNLFLAIVISLIIRLLAAMHPQWMHAQQDHQGYLIMSTLFQLFILNLALTILNLLPIHPLDGGKILYGILPKRIANTFDSFFSSYGFMILLLLLFTGMLSKVVGLPVFGLARLLL